MDRPNKPSAIPVSPSMPQPVVDISGQVVTASLPSRDSVTVNLFGATVTSWKTADGAEQLFLSTASKLDGSKAIRGGIPLVFPVFGPPPKNHATSSLSQHGFARSTYWEFLGKSSSESSSRKADDSVKLDFGLSSSMLDEKTRKAWPYEFGLVFSVTLGKGTLETGMHVQNKGDKSFDFNCLFHSYLRIKDISKVSVHGLHSATYLDKTISGIPTVTETESAVRVSSVTDRVYTPIVGPTGTPVAVRVGEVGEAQTSTRKFIVTRDQALPNVTVWNPWAEGAASMGDFEPKDGYKQMICIEPGAVGEWTKLDAGDAWEASQTITASTAPPPLT